MKFKSLWFRPFTPSRILAVDCGASHVACGLFAEGEGGRLTLEKFAIEKVSPDPAQDGDWSERIAAALSSVISRSGLGGGCHLALPGHLTLTRFTRTPSVDETRRESAVRFEAQQNIPCPLETVVWDHLLIGDDGLDLEVMLAAAKVETIGAIHAAVSGAGFIVEQITPAGLALFRAFRHHSPSVREGIVVADVGARSTNLVFIDGERWFMRTLAMGGNSVTQALAGELGDDFSQAEEVKLRLSNETVDVSGDSRGHEALQRATSSFAARLRLEIIRTTAGCRPRQDQIQPAALFLSGGGSLLPTLPAMLRESLKIRVVLFDPLRRVDVALTAREAQVAATAPSLASMVGLASGLIHRKQPDINLLPQDRVDEIETGRLLPRRIAAATLAVALLLQPLLHLKAGGERLEKELTALDGRMGRGREADRARSEQSAELKAIEARSAALGELSGTRLRWAEFLADLERRLGEVGDAWLDKLHFAPAEPSGPPRRPGSPAADIKLTVGGRLLDVANPVSKVSADSYLRAKQLMETFAASTFVSSVENVRFDGSLPGMLGFDCTLVIDGHHFL